MNSRRLISSENLGLHQAAELGAQALLDLGGINQRDVLTTDAPGDVAVGRGGRGFGSAQGEGFTAVGAHDHLLVLQHQPKQRQGQDVGDEGLKALGYY